MRRFRTHAACSAAAILFIRLIPAAAGVQADNFVRRGDELFRGGQFAEAEGAYANALAADQQNYQAVLRLGEIALLGNRFAEAEEQLRRAMKLSPDEKRPKELLAEVLYRQDRFEEAAALRREVGPDAVANNLASFKGLRPYETPGDGGVPPSAMRPGPSCHRGLAVPSIPRNARGRICPSVT